MEKRKIVTFKSKNERDNLEQIGLWMVFGMETLGRLSSELNGVARLVKSVASKENKLKSKIFFWLIVVRMDRNV